MLLIGLICSCLALLHFLLNSRKFGLWSPDSIFVPLQLTMVLGLIAIVDSEDSVGVEYVYIVAGAYTMYVLTSILVGVAISPRISLAPRVRVEIYTPGRFFLFAIGLSVLISIIYFQAVGYNTFLLSLQGLFSGEDLDVATMRLESYGGSRYLFPGYVNQFKNVLLPALSIIMVHWLYHIRHPARLLVAIGLSLFVSLMVLGTGQRGAFVVVGSLVVAYAFNVLGVKAFRYVLLFFAAFLPILLTATAANGRTDVSEGDIGSSIFSMLEQLWDRVFFDNQSAGLTGFRYTSGLETKWGFEWFESLRGLLPGVEGSSLSGDIFALVYGSDRGTAPPSLWGSVHYNFGIIGIIIVPTLMAVSFVLFTLWVRTRSSISTLGMVGVSGVAAVCGSWRSGGPEYLLNYGLVPFSLLAVIGCGKVVRSNILNSDRQVGPV